MRLSDTRLTSIRKGKLIKAREIKRWAGANMSEDWTSGKRNGRRIGIRVWVVNSGIGPRRSDIALRRSDVTRRQHADWAIHRRRGRFAEKSNEASEEPMTCRTTNYLCFIIIYLDRISLCHN